VSRSYKEFKQGIFHPIHKEKYKGKNLPVYRSGLEMNVMLILDKNPNVLEWESESGKCIVPYINPSTNRPARYFVDFWIKIKINESIKEFLIEVKPKSQVTLREYTSKAKPSTILHSKITFAINQAKWNAAKEKCDKLKSKGTNIEFVVITEENIEQLKEKK
jgi:hypothetical protein